MIIPDNILSTIKENKGIRKNFINKTKYFYGSDSKEKWEKNKNKKDKSYYIDNPIEYKFNNSGYRTYDEFDQKNKGVITLGCSFTEGIGLHLEDVWSYKIAKHLDKPLYNLAVGGKGIRDSFERLVSFGDYLDYNYVFLFVPPKGRVSMYFGDNDIISPIDYPNIFQGYKYLDFLPSVFEEVDFVKWKTILFNGSKFEQDFYQFTYLSLIKSYLQSRGKVLIYETWDNLNQLYSMKNKDEIICKDIEARDGHWGTKKQHFIYELFIKKYEELNSNRSS
jgi:hypothetical protein